MDSNQLFACELASDGCWLERVTRIELAGSWLEAKRLTIETTPAWCTNSGTVSEAWRVIGCFEPAMVREIPCVPAAAVRISDTSDVVYSITLRGEIESKGTIQEFRECVDLGSAFRVDLGEWPPDHVLFIEAGALMPIWVTLDEADARLRAFVSQHIEEGHKALPFDRELALKHFDLARRVSNEPLDVLRVCYLLEGEYQGIWTEWLEKYYPDLDHRAEALKLGLIAG